MDELTWRTILNFENYFAYFLMSTTNLPPLNNFKDQINSLLPSNTITICDFFLLV